MQISELIERLSKFPPHYTVEVLKVRAPERDDLTADIVDVTHCLAGKIVSLEIDVLLP